MITALTCVLVGARSGRARSAARGVGYGPNADRLQRHDGSGAKLPQPNPLNAAVGDAGTKSLYHSDNNEEKYALRVVSTALDEPVNANPASFMGRCRPILAQRCGQGVAAAPPRFDMIWQTIYDIRKMAVLNNGEAVGQYPPETVKDLEFLNYVSENMQKGVS